MALNIDLRFIHQMTEDYELLPLSAAGALDKMFLTFLLMFQHSGQAYGDCVIIYAAKSRVVVETPIFNCFAIE